MLQRLKGVFACLNKRGVRYVVIGGIAAVLHGVPRPTFDVDLLIDPTRENAQALLNALIEAGLGTATLIDSEGLLANEITVFSDRVRVDVLTSAPGLAFDDAWGHREVMTYESEPFFVVDRAGLIASKRAAGRAKDLEDVRALEASGSEP